MEKTNTIDIITESKIDLSAVLSQDVHGRRTGALVLFSGEVRADIDEQGREVAYLYYDAERRIATDMIKQIVETAQKDYSLSYAFCSHRVGKIDISECAIVIVTASSHRDAAYRANRYILDRVKKEAPIWKKEVYGAGGHRWA